MKILIVDDQVAVANLIAELFCKPNGYGYKVVASLAAAKESAKEKGWDLVILDLGLPDSKEWDTLVELKPLFRDVPIVVIAGAIPAGGVAQGKRYGAADILSKPWTSQIAFVEAIDKAMATPQHPEVDDLGVKLGEAKETLAAIKETGEAAAAKVIPESKSVRISETS